MSSLWVSDKGVKKWIVPRSVDGDDDDGVQVMACGHFQKSTTEFKELSNR